MGHHMAVLEKDSEVWVADSQMIDPDRGVDQDHAGVCRLGIAFTPGSLPASWARRRALSRSINARSAWRTNAVFSVVPVKRCASCTRSSSKASVVLIPPSKARWSASNDDPTRAVSGAVASSVRRGADDSDGRVQSDSSHAPVALVDHPRSERPGLDQLQPDVFGNRRQVGRAAADDHRMAEYAQLVDESELERLRGQAGTADRDVTVCRVERYSDLLGHRPLGEPGVTRNAVECAAEDDLRDAAPDVGELDPERVGAYGRIRLPRQHGLVQPAAAEIAAEPAYLRGVKTKLLLVRNRPRKAARAVVDEAVHRDAYRVDQHGFDPFATERQMVFVVDLDIGSVRLRAALHSW